MAVQTASPGKGLRFHWRWWWLVIGLLAMIVLGILAFAIFQPIKVLPRMRLAPGYILTDQDGQRLTNEDLLGKVVVYNFLYTGCGAECAAMNATMRAVQDRLAEVNPGIMPVQFVTISFDPERDTPEKLNAYAMEQGADPAQWRFATGDPARMKQIIGDGFEAYYAPDGQGGFQFDPSFTLVDGWGIIRGEYRYQVETPDADRILRHIGVLAEEIQKSKGANKLIYEAAHLFLCYSP
jgi:protein SCO1/2